MTEQLHDNAANQDAELLEQHDLGLAGRMARNFIDSPLSPLLMMASLAIGILGLLFTPRQEDPQISVPMVDIFVQYPGAGAEQVSSLVTEPLERIMSEIPGVRHVYSASQRAQAIVTVEFEVGEELGPSIVKVHDKLQSNLDRIPPGVSMPLVKPKGVDDVPVVAVTLWSDSVDDGALRTLALDVLQRLQEVPDTGQGFVVGGRSEQIRVEVFPERLAGYGISLDQVANSIRSANAEQSAGSVESGSTSFSVQTGAFLRTPQEIARLVVTIRNGAPIYVRDIAQVFHGPEETGRMVSFYAGPAYQGENPVGNGAPGVTIALAKKEGTNGVTVARAILERLDRLRGQLIPDNVYLDVTRDYGKTANDKVNELLFKLVIASAAVTVLCLIGLGYRAAIVVVTVIPIVVLTTVASAWMLGYTIDRVSLFALIFSIGILVDDAAVLVENIFRRWLLAGRTTLGIAVDAVREVGNPTVLATFTVIAALLPMGFVSGMMGPYMRPIPVLGSSAMFLSLLAAFIFTPWLAWKVRPRLAALEGAEQREERSRKAVARVYEPVIWPLIRRRGLAWLFLVGLIVATLLSCALFYTQHVAVKMLPFDNKPEFNVVVNMPEGTALPVTANVAEQLAQALRQMPEVTALQSYVGTASPFNFNGLVRHYYLRQEPWQADIQVMLLDKRERERSSHELAVAARELLTPIAQPLGARIQVIEMPPGPPVLQTVVAEIYGPDAATRRQVAQDMLIMFERGEGIVDTDTLMAEPYAYWRFEVDREKAIRNGVSVETINRNLSMAMGGYRLGDVKRGAPLEPTYIVIQAPLAVRSQLSRLANLPVPSSDGTVMPLAELGRFVRVPEDSIIFHKDLRPVEFVSGEMEGRLGAPIYGMLSVEDQLERYTSPDGVQVTGMPWGLIGPPADSIRSGFEWTGEWTVTYETFRDMGLAFMAALLLIYGLIVWEFKDFAIAGLIMAPIPLTLIGIVPGHWVMDAEFTATSMIGFIALAGIIVRNSILLVEFVRMEVANGSHIREAVVAAGRTRMRPIVITALALILGSAAIITDPIFQGMAVSLLFGTGVSTILTMIVLPLGCISAVRHFESPESLGDVDGDAAPSDAALPAAESRTPLLIRLWGKFVGALIMAFYLIRAVFIVLLEAIKAIWGRLSRRKDSPGPSNGDGGPAGSSPLPGGGGGPAAPVAQSIPSASASTTSSPGSEALSPPSPGAQSATPTSELSGGVEPTVVEPGVADAERAVAQAVSATDEFSALSPALQSESVSEPVPAPAPETVSAGTPATVAAATPTRAERVATEAAEEFTEVEHTAPSKPLAPRSAPARPSRSNKVESRATGQAKSRKSAPRKRRSASEPGPAAATGADPSRSGSAGTSGGAAQARAAMTESQNEEPTKQKPRRRRGIRLKEESDL